MLTPPKTTGHHQDHDTGAMTLLKGLCRVAAAAVAKMKNKMDDIGVVRPEHLDPLPELVRVAGRGEYQTLLETLFEE